MKKLETGEWQGAGLFSDEALFCRECVAFVGAGAELTSLGVIIRPVKFEGADIAVFHAYHVMCKGVGDEYFHSYCRAGNVLCSERYDGFVNGVVCDTETSAMASWKLLSADIVAPKVPVMDAAGRTRKYKVVKYRSRRGLVSSVGAYLFDGIVIHTGLTFEQAQACCPREFGDGWYTVWEPEPEQPEPPPVTMLEGTHPDPAFGYVPTRPAAPPAAPALLTPPAAPPVAPNTMARKPIMRDKIIGLVCLLIVVVAIGACTAFAIKYPDDKVDEEESCPALVGC